MIANHPTGRLLIPLHRTLDKHHPPGLYRSVTTGLPAPASPLLLSHLWRSHLPPPSRQWAGRRLHGHFHSVIHRPASRPRRSDINTTSRKRSASSSVVYETHFTPDEPSSSRPIAGIDTTSTGSPDRSTPRATRSRTLPGAGASGPGKSDSVGRARGGGAPRPAYRLGSFTQPSIQFGWTKRHVGGTARLYTGLGGGVDGVGGAGMFPGGGSFHAKAERYKVSSIGVVSSRTPLMFSV